MRRTPAGEAAFDASGGTLFANSGKKYTKNATRRDVSFIIVGADAHVGPSVIGIVLQIPRLPAGKGFQNLDFGALLVTFPAREK